MNVAPQPVPSSDAVRQALLGQHGSGPDAGMGPDALDRVQTMVAGLDGDGVVDLAAVLAELAADPDAVVANGAVLALSRLVELAAPIEVPRSELVAALAERLPALVVAQARAWVGPSDSSVVAGLGAHHHRIAVATAVRPWDEQAIRAVETAARRQEWHEAELDAVLRVMRDDAPELTAPRGVGDVDLGGRWWIEAERLWDWTLWRCDDGRAVLERVEGGVGMWTSVQALSDDGAAQVVAAVVAGIELTGREIAPASPPGS